MYVANIPIVIHANGQRKTIPAGAQVPADLLSAHDIKALQASGALADSEAVAKAQEADAAARKAAQADFQAARQAVQDAAASVAAPASAPVADEPAVAVAKETKTPTKKSGK
ncbi:MAG: hypothetical protein LBE78_12940 [Burkholderiaceae bacterium]|jgi:predicted DNA-binding transcriptional regulator YafY|nr:hypothetical protein [Burkholderiaceae bacterium]